MRKRSIVTPARLTRAADVANPAGSVRSVTQSRHTSPNKEAVIHYVHETYKLQSVV
ncbi:MAG: hypothetical protein WC165_10950 [Dysgonamonadaceae bacterium]